MKTGFGRGAAGLALAAGLVLAGGLAGLQVHAQGAGQGAGQPAGQGKDAGAAPAERLDGVPVRVAQAVRSNVPVTLQNIGSVQPLQTVLVRPRVDGQLDQVFFTEGQDVKPGDKLAQIDPRPYAAALAQTLAKRAADQAQLAGVQRDLARTSALVSSNAATRQQLDQQTAQVAQLQASIQGDEAAIASARLNLGFTTITAPIGGRVGLRQVDAGNLVQASSQQGIVTITQIHPIAVLFSLPQDALPEVQARMRQGKLDVTALTTDGTRVLAQGTLLTLDNAVDPATGTIRLKAEFPNEDDRLWPGQFVQARLLLHTLQGALTVSSTAVEHGPDGLYVYVVKPDRTVVRQAVTETQDDGKTAVIASGLQAGETVVVAGQSRLRNGVKVAAMPAAEGS